MSALLKSLQQGVEQLDLVLSTQECQQFLDYLQLIQKWNKTHNLTAIRDPSDMVVRHILDSLSIAVFLNKNDTLDLGAGLGVPGIPLAIIEPDRKVICIDASEKRTLFLKQVKLELGLQNLEVTHGRIEDLVIGAGAGAGAGAGIDVLVKRPVQFISRALASLSQILGWSQHLIHPGDRFLAMKGQLSEIELEGLPENFELVKVETISVPFIENEERHLVELRCLTTNEENVIGKNISGC